MMRASRFMMTAAAIVSVLLTPAWAQPDAWSPPPPMQADLAQCYAWAQDQSESLHMQQEQIVQLEQQFKQALATALPNLSLNASEKWLAAGGAGAYVSPQPQVNIALAQPLFTGLREYAAMSASKNLGQSAELQFKHARTLLFQDVSKAFYLAFNLQSQLDNVQDAVTLSASRIAELRRFEALGKSRHSEVVLTESQEASLQAQAESLKGQIAVARELLSFLTGKDLSLTKLDDKLGRVRSLPPEETLLARAYDRTDVQALHKQALAQEDQVRIAKSARLPLVSLLGNYYFYRMPMLEPIRWDAGVTAGLPLFAGGGPLAAIRLAESQVSQARYNFELGARTARTQIHSSYMTLGASMRSTDAAEKAYLKADESYHLELKEYRLGLVTNLDVIQALNSLVGTKTTFDTDLVQTKLALLQLQVSAEELP